MSNNAKGKLRIIALTVMVMLVVVLATYPAYAVSYSGYRMDILRREVSHIPLTHVTGTEFDDTWTCDVDDGNRLNIWIDNSEGDYDAHVVIFDNDGDRSSFNVPAGETETIIKAGETGDDIAGEWRIVINNTYGHYLDLYVKVRQFIA